MLYLLFLSSGPANRRWLGGTVEARATECVCIYIYIYIYIYIHIHIHISLSLSISGGPV